MEVHAGAPIELNPTKSQRLNDFKRTQTLSTIAMENNTHTFSPISTHVMLRVFFNKKDNPDIITRALNYSPDKISNVCDPFSPAQAGGRLCWYASSKNLVSSNDVDSHINWLIQFMSTRMLQVNCLIGSDFIIDACLVSHFSGLAGLTYFTSHQIKELSSLGLCISYYCEVSSKLEEGNPAGQLS